MGLAQTFYDEIILDFFELNILSQHLQNKHRDSHKKYVAENIKDWLSLHN